jgi:cbb3-type cytochrome oxidase subunit 3
MREWLVRDFTILGISGQSWMLIALAMILIAIVVALWSPR